MYDSSRPYEMRFDGHFRQLSVDFPRSMFQDRLKTTERVTARIFSGLSGPGRFLYSFVQSLVLGRNDGDLMIANHLQDNLMELLGIALFSLGPASPIHESDAKMAALSRVKAYVLANLSNPSLSPTGISKAQGLSLRNLYYLFESDGSTVWRFIQDTRLDQCRRDIEDARMSGRSISDIALSRGFKDSAHFSRAFRDRFGLTPRECRAVWRAHAETGAGAGKLHAQTRDYS
ncbi:Transcriptional activator NphR [compost metagenome]